jgi:FkbM family methyltransferase
MQTKKSIVRWLLNGSEPNAYVIPSIKPIDRLVILVSRLSYISLRILLRIVIGKKKREKINSYHRLKYENTTISGSFYLYMYLYRFVRFLKLGNPKFVKLNVRKYNYKAYCPVTTEDYSHMTEREDHILEHFQPLSGDVVVDVGAHLGRYALISSQRIGKEGRVIAIEANPQVIGGLKKNIELNKAKNITVLNYAVYSSQQNKKIKLFLCEESTNNIYSPHNTVMLSRDKITYNRSKKERFVEVDADTQRFVEVDADTLDNIISSHGIDFEDVNWIKIDVEGAELEVLKGAHNILSKSKNLSLLIEVHLLPEYKNLYEDILLLLKPHNFKLQFEKLYQTGERHIILKK